MCSGRVNYDGPPNAYFRIEGGAALPDGGIVLCGRWEEVALALRIRADGTLQWAYTINPSDRESLDAIAASRDGGFIAAGHSRRRPWLVKLAGDGRVQWQKTFTTGSHFRRVVETAEGNIVAAGDGMVVRTSASGAPSWAKAEPPGFRLRSLLLTANGEIVLAAIGAADGLATLAFTKLNAKGGTVSRWLFQPRGTRVMDGAQQGVIVMSGAQMLFAPSLASGGSDPAALVFATSGARMPASCGGWFREAPATFADTSTSVDVLSFDAAALVLKETKISRRTSPSSVAAERFACPSNAPAGGAPAGGAPAAKTPASRGFDPNAHLTQKKAQWSALLAQKNFARLDEAGASLRASRSFTDPMWWDLYEFYETILNFTSDETARIALLREWLRARPQSVTARIALARALRDAAWKRRGPGYSDSVTAKGAKEFESWLAQARSVLSGAGPDAQQDVHYWIQLAQHTGVGGGDVREVLRRALKLHHDPSLLALLAQHLQPRWGGTIPEYRAFTEEAAQLTKAAWGDGMYAWLAYQARVSAPPETKYEVYGFDWSRIRRGMEDIIAKNRAWWPSYHRYALMAHVVQDKQKARELFQRPELAWYSGAEDLWRSRAMYEMARQWALQEDLSARQWPQILMENRLELGGVVHRRFASFLVDTPRGVVAVSVVPDKPGRQDADDPIEDARRAMTKWTMWPPAQPKTILVVRSLDTKNPPNPQLGVALALAPFAGSPPVKPLKLAPAGRRPTKAYVVACKWTADSCRQVVLGASYAGESKGAGSPWRMVWIGLPKDADAQMAAGAAVLDEEGNVLGVGRRAIAMSADYALTLEVDDLRTVLAP